LSKLAVATALSNKYLKTPKVRALCNEKLNRKSSKKKLKMQSFSALGAHLCAWQIVSVEKLCPLQMIYLDVNMYVLVGIICVHMMENKTYKFAVCLEKLVDK
jgi:hypothetical protein